MIMSGIFPLLTITIMKNLSVYILIGATSVQNLLLDNRPMYTRSFFFSIHSFTVYRDGY